MRIARFLTALIGGLLVGACASAREIGYDGRPVYRVSEVDVAPRLIGCHAYAPLPDATARVRRYISVRVTFVVVADGSVEPRSVMVNLGPPRVDTRQQEEARALATGCAYDPAELGGETVSVRLARTFRVERPVLGDTLPMPRPSP